MFFELLLNISARFWANIAADGITWEDNKIKDKTSKEGFTNCLHNINAFKINYMQ